MSYFLLLPKFAAGQIILSPLIQTCDVDALPLLRRHLAGDWTDQDEHDCDSNEKALLNDEAILTLYEAVDSKGNSMEIALMTEADRSFTLIFVPGEPIDLDTELEH